MAAWHSVGMTPDKAKRMEMTEENFDRVIAMRDSLIEDQVEEILALKHKIFKLKQFLRRESKHNGST